MNRQEWVEKQVVEKEALYEFPMPLRNKQLARQLAANDFDQNERSNRDYVYGQDEGEPPYKR